MGKNTEVHSTESNQKFSLGNTLRSVYKTQMLDQIHDTIPVVTSYINEKIKKYETKFVKCLRITQCLFVMKGGFTITFRKSVFFRILSKLMFKQRLDYLPLLPSLRLRAVPSLPDLTRCRTVEKVQKEQNKKLI